MYHVHCSILSLWLSKCLQLYTPSSTLLCFWYSQHLHSDAFSVTLSLHIPHTRLSTVGSHAILGSFRSKLKMCVCVCALRIVSVDKVLHFINYNLLTEQHNSIQVHWNLALCCYNTGQWASHSLEQAATSTTPDTLFRAKGPCIFLQAAEIACFQHFSTPPNLFP